MSYWVATTYSKSQKYSCCFSEFSDAEKWIDVVASNNNHHRPSGLSFDFHEELRSNFNLKCFEFHDDAIKYQEDFLGVKNES